MQNNVKYQLERAQDALRTAIELGAKQENPHLISHVADMLGKIESLFFAYPEEEKAKTTVPSIKINTPWNYYDSITNVSPNISFSTMAGQPTYTRTVGSTGTDVISFS